MALPTPPRYTNPIPNNPFYYPEGNFIYGDTGPLIVGSGLNIDYTTGVISAAGGGGGVTSIFAGPGIGVNANTGVVTITNTGVTSITTGAGLTGGPITTTGTISLGTTGVTPGNYTLANITVDAQGRISTASNGTAVLSVTGTAPVNVTTGVNPTISIAPSSTSSAGIVQLNNTLTSNSITEALTAAQGLVLQNQINALSVATNLTFAGTFDASLAHMDSVTTEGAAEGFTLGADLPAPAASNDNFFVIVTTEGTYSPPGGGGPYAANRGDWFLSNGTTWEYLNVGADLPVASTGSQGVVELATVAETQAGTSTTLAVTPAGAAATYISRPTLTSKGAILTATAASTPSALGVGSNDQVLIADSTCSTGLKWGPVPGLPTLATATIAGIVYGCMYSHKISYGYGSLQNSSGGFNSAFGENIMSGTVTGGSNTGAGWGALAVITSGGENTSVGTFSSCSLTTGCSNTVLGKAALYGNVSGSCNTALGADSGRSITGSLNTVVGYCSGRNLTTGTNNLVLGANVCALTAAGSCQLAIGYGTTFGASCYWLTGDSTKAIKPGAGIVDCANSCGTAGQVLMSNGANAICWGTVTSPTAATPAQQGLVFGCTTSTTSVGLGCNILGAGGSSNIAVGHNILCANTTGIGNVGMGICSLTSNTTGSCNVGLGWCALRANTTGSSNVGIGQSALCSNSTGSSNVAIGNGALGAGLSAFANVAIGQSALAVQSDGCQNVAIGIAAARSIGLSCCNVFIGPAVYYQGTTGDGNVMIGNQAGGLMVPGGNNNIIIGQCAQASGGAVSNTITLGNSLMTVIRAAVTTITSLSDARDKTDITALPVGLDFINSLNPVKFTWQQREPNEIKDGTTEAGFIAQELQAAEADHNANYLGLVYDENPDKLEASPGKLIPVLVKAVQELSAKVDELEAKLAANG